MSTLGIETEVQRQLLDRRGRLENAIQQNGNEVQLRGLLEQVDAALDRINQGTYGICETCHDTIEQDRLERNPLIRYCLDHLTAPERQALQDDLDLALRIQQNLLPNREFRAAGWEAYYHYEPLGPVSGDYCDLVAEDDKSIFFLLGDAAGKGVAASLLMSQLHAIFRTLMALRLTPGQLLERANRLFCEFMLPGHYATVICGRADDSGKIEIANAGHCLPLVLRNGQNITIQNSTFPLGLFCESEYATTTLQLGKDEGLLLYSDGLLEANNSSGDEYGEERLQRLFMNCNGRTPKELIENCLEDLRKFQLGQARKDDLTVLSILRTAAAGAASARVA
ncbi:MAG: serine phosphatase [Candidatus Angelobacter sp.]|nr:serine phosphatase [Candidatus Angelobacter sp.]